MTPARAEELVRSGRGLYLVLTSPTIPHVELARAAVVRGVPMLQLREKRLPDDRLLALAGEIAGATRGTDTLFIVNDRPDVAAAVGADGVHLGQTDESIAVARELMRPGTIVGLSARTPEEAEAAARSGADYTGVGPVFPTGTKPDALAPIGLDGLRTAIERTPDIPTAAIGGVTHERAPAVLAAGARYAAVISDICFADDPIAAMDRFLGQIGPDAA